MRTHARALNATHASHASPARRHSFQCLFGPRSRSTFTQDQVMRRAPGLKAKRREIFQEFGNNPAIAIPCRRPLTAPPQAANKRKARIAAGFLIYQLCLPDLLPAAISAAAEAEGYTGAAAIIAGSAVVAVRARSVVAVAVVVRPVMTVAPVAVVMTSPMPMATPVPVLRADVG